MTHKELDRLWFQAMEESIKDGEMVARYHFAALVAAAERERIIAQNAPEIEKINAHIKALEDEISAIRARSNT